MINFKDFTVDNGAIQDLSELLFISTFTDPDLEVVCTTETGVYDGKKLGYIDSLGDVGKDAKGCSPTYENINVTGIEKTWSLGDYQIPLKLCYDDLENTIAKYALNTGTDESEIIGTVYWDKIVIPLLERAMAEMAWRIAWFGDKAAKNIADSGLLTAGVKPNLFTMTDGFFKRLKAITASNPHQLTAIAANTAKNSAATLAVTYESQKVAIRQDGVAVGIVDAMLSDADSRIFDKDDHAIFMTNSLFKALRNDVKRLHNLQLELTHVTSGINLSSYDGHPVVVLDMWDRMIKKYEDDGTKLNCPHRAIVTSASNLFIGTPDRDKIAKVDVTFDHVTRLNHIYAASKIGTLVGEDDLVQCAW